MLRTRETEDERIDRLEARDREIMEHVIEELRYLREAGYSARMGWDAQVEEVTAMVGCDQCGRMVKPAWGLPMAYTCQDCYMEMQEAAGI